MIHKQNNELNGNDDDIKRDIDQSNIDRKMDDREINGKNGTFSYVDYFLNEMKKERNQTKQLPPKLCGYIGNGIYCYMS